MSYSYGGGGQPAAYGAPAAGYAPAPQAYGQPAAGPYGGGAMGQAAHGAYGQPPMQSAQGYGGVSTAPYQSAPAAAPPASGPDSVAMWFRAIDTDASGFLDARELQQALAKGNLHYGLTDTDQMVRAFDTRGSRSLNVQEFQKLHEVSTQAPHLLHTPRVSTSPQRKRPHRLTNPAGRAGGGA